MTNAVIAAVCLATVVACSATRPPIPPTFSIALPTNEFGEFTLDIFDESGFVTGGRSDRQAADGPTGVVAVPDRNELLVSWIGGACSHRPVLFVRGDLDELHLVIVPSPVELSLAPVSCPAVGIFSSATLTLTQPVEQAHVAIEEER